MKINNYYKNKVYIHYSNCHEDVEMILKNTGNNAERILSIASGGDNSFALLLLNPKEVICIDSNISQIHLVKLKKTGIKYLTYDEYLTFIGVYEGDSVVLYEKINQYLDIDTKNYFDEHLYLIKDIKIVNCGRFEYYFQVFSKKVLPFIHSKKTIDKFMNCETLDEQRQFYKKKFNNWRFRLMFKVFFSKFVMKRVGRDKDYFKYNKGSLSKELKTRFELGVFNNLNKYNPYLQYVVLNKFINYPTYIQKENYDFIKQNIDKVTIRESSLLDIINDNKQYDLMNLSDVFEYIPNSEMEMYEKLISKSLNDKGRVVFWNMQNTRTFKKMKRIEVSLKEDRAFYYKDILVYEKEE